MAITYPGSVLGPDDPYLGESNTVALQMARGLVPLTTTGRYGIVDVRDESDRQTANRPREGRPDGTPAHDDEIALHAFIISGSWRISSAG